MKKKTFSIAMILIFIISIFLFYFFDLNKFFTYENVNEVRDFILSFSILSPIILVLLVILLNTFGLPTVFFIFLSGYLYGYFWGFLLGWLATILACSIAFTNSRYFFRDIFVKKFGKNKAVLKLEKYTEKYKWKAVLFFRIFFIFPYNIQNIAYSLTSIKFPTYFIFTVIGSLAQTTLFAISGALLASGSLSVTGVRDYMLYIIITLSIIVSIIFTIMLINNKRKKSS